MTELRAKQRVSVIVTDLDNTLFDWFDIWISSFKPMLDLVVKRSGLPPELLKKEIRAVHQQYGTSEFSRLVEALPSLQKLHPGENLPVIYSDAIAAFRSGRSSALRLYPTVFETLWAIRNAGCLIIGYTESRAFYTNYRIRRLCLDGLLEYVHSPADHALPEGVDREVIRRYRAQDYALKVTQHHHTPEGEVKPNPSILKSILADTGANPSETIYVGDNLMKDIVMAQEVGVTDVWAKYGEVRNRSDYELLREVSHWPDAAVEKEKTIAETVTPTFELRENLAELLSLFEFTPFTGR